MKVHWVPLAAAAAMGPALATDVLGAVPTDPPGQAEDVRTAERYANDAYDAYQEKDFATAVSLYLKALEASPSADIVYNIAKIYDTKLKDRKLAMTFYRRYIADPGAVPERVKTANERLAALRDAEMAANEQPTPGANGDAMSGGSSSAAPQAAPPPADDGLSAVQVTGIVVGVAGLVGLGIGTGFGVAAMGDADDANAVCQGNDCTTQEGVDSAKSASTKAHVSTIGFVAGGALLATGILMLAFGSSEGGPSGADSVSLQWTPAVGPLGGGFQLTGRW